MNSRRILLSILIVVFSVYSPWPSLAQEKTGNAQIDLTAEERAFLAGKELRLGVDSARPPFEFLDEKGVYSGISAGFIQACLQRLGVPFVLVPGLTVAAAMKKMSVGEIDVIPKIAPDPERAKSVIFTRSHATFASVIVTRQNVRSIRGIDDLAGLKVGVLKGLIVEASMQRDFPNLPLISLPDVRTALVELSAGNIDAYIEHMAIVSYNIDKLGLNNLKIAAQTPYNYEMAFGVRKDWPLLASALDKALASLSKEERSAITGRWLTIEYQPNIDWKVYSPVGAVLLIIIVGVIIWNRSLRRVIRDRTRIQEELKENTRLLELRGVVKATLSQLSVELQQSTTIEELARTFLSKVAPLTGAAYGVFYHMDEQKRVLRAVGGYGWMEAEAGSRLFRIGQGLVGQCALEKKPLSFNTPQGSNVRVTWGGGRFDPREILLLPVLEHDHVLAVIEFGSLHPFAEEHRALLDELMPIVALNLQINQRNLTTQELLEKSRDQIAELSKTRKATLNILEDLDAAKKETESTMQKIDAMSQAVYDALIMIDAQGKVQFWNQGAVKLFGYSAAEAMGMDFHTTAVPQELREKAQAGMATFAATGQGALFGATVQTTAINRAGLTFPVEVNLSPFQIGEKWFAVGTVRDITDRTKAEIDLKERMEDLERFSRLTINREEKMIQLKEEINALLVQAGQEKKYKIVE